MNSNNRLDGQIICYLGKEFEVNDNMNNKAIKCHIMDDSLMKLARFTEYREGYWYYCRCLKPMSHEISFNMSINKNDLTDWRIDILDEAFLQPYDFQAMMQREYEGEELPGDFHHKINEQVEYEMEHLTRLGIISGWERGDYI